MKYKTKIIRIIIFAATHTSFICSMFVPFFKENGISPVEFSMLFTIKKSSRIIFDIPFGILFDKFSPRLVFLIGRVSKLISFLILTIEPNFTTLAFAMLFDGISYSAMYGKISVLIFNILKYIEKKEIFPRVYSIYYGIVDISLAIVQVASGFIFKTGGFKLVIKYSIIAWFLTFFTIFLLPNIKDKEESQNKRKKKNILDSLIDLKKLFFEKKYFRVVIFFYAFINFFAWHFGPMAGLILLDMGYNPFQVSNIAAVCKIAPLLGVILPFSFKYVCMRKMTKIVIPVIFFITISAFVYNRYLLIFAMLMPLFFYPLLEGNMEKFVDNESDKEIRSTVSSVNSVFTTILSVIITMIFGFIGTLTSIKNSFRVITFLSFIYITFICFLILKYFKKEEKLS